MGEYREQSLAIHKKNNVFVRIFKWISSHFHTDYEELQDVPVENTPEITIPKTIQVSQKIDENLKNNKGSLEYLYNLSDNELDKLDEEYDVKIEDEKNELCRLEYMLQSYKKSIKQLQDKTTAIE